MRIKCFLYIALIVFLFSSCEFEMSNNGDLDGFWQMTEMQIDGKGAKDMRNEGIVVGVQFQLMNIRKTKGGMDVYCRFDKKKDYLRLYDFRLRVHDESDNPVEDVSGLEEFGLFSLDETFHIEKLTSSVMMLKSERSALKFRKY